MIYLNKIKFKNKLNFNNNFKNYYMSDKIQVEIYDKHRDFIKHYIPNDTYWGLGIENEVYLEIITRKKYKPRYFCRLRNGNCKRYSIAS
jgi:hypothetical protein